MTRSWRNTPLAERLKLVKSVYSHRCATAQEIGSILGVSFNSIKALYEKHGDQLTAYPLKVHGAPVKEAGPEQMISMLPAEGFKCRSVLLIDIEARQCRWPVNDDKPMLMCGNHIDGKHPSYCSYHHRLNFGLGSVSERNALNGLGVSKNAITGSRI